MELYSDLLKDIFFLEISVDINSVLLLFHWGYSMEGCQANLLLKFFITYSYIYICVDQTQILNSKYIFCLINLFYLFLA